jgi:hypothetical protein
LVHRDEGCTGGGGSHQVDCWLRVGTSRSSIVKKLVGSDREWFICSVTDVIEGTRVNYAFDFDETYFELVVSQTGSAVGAS